MSCFQCDMDIPHVCYARMPGARWGWTDEAVATLEAAQQYLLSPPQRGPCSAMVPVAPGTSRQRPFKRRSRKARGAAR